MTTYLSPAFSEIPSVLLVFCVSLCLVCSTIPGKTRQVSVTRISSATNFTCIHLQQIETDTEMMNRTEQKMHTSSDSFLTSYQTIRIQNWMIIGLGIMLAAIIFYIFINQKAAEKQAEDLIKQLQQEITELKMDSKQPSYLENIQHILNILQTLQKLFKKTKS